jgi:ferredoxin
MKANDPGLTDFGSGNIIALTSQCLRCAKKPTLCTVCSEFCPVGALETHTEGRPRVNPSCIKCGACIGVCPLNALAASTRTLQQILRLSLQATLRVEDLVLSCERTTGLLRLEAQTDRPDAATEALRLVEDTQAGEHLQKVPCLGMLTKEFWFALLNEIGVSKLETLSVFLPVGQCAECPVNAKNNIEDQFAEAIDRAEIWTGQSVEIITRAEDLPQTRKANVRAYLVSGTEVDRRGAFTGFLRELKQSWDDNAKAGNRALDEVRWQRERKKSFERTRLAADIKKGKTGVRRPIEVPTRYLLVEALGRNPAHASEVRVTVSTTDSELCTLCETCIEVCPVRARSIIETNLREKPALSADGKNAGDGTDGDAEAHDGAGTHDDVNTRDGTDNSDADGDAEAHGDTDSSIDDAVRADDQSGDYRQVIVDGLYCVACSACLQACPADACSFTEVEGGSFLLDEVSSDCTEESNTVPV